MKLGAGTLACSTTIVPAFLSFYHVIYEISEKIHPGVAAGAIVPTFVLLCCVPTAVTGALFEVTSDSLGDCIDISENISAKKKLLNGLTEILGNKK